MKDKIFSISGAAEHLGVSALTLRKWVAQTKVRAFRTPGGHRRFRKSDLDAILNYDEKTVNKLALIIKKIESLDLAKDSQEYLNAIVKELREII